MQSLGSFAAPYLGMIFEKGSADLSVQFVMPTGLLGLLTLVSLYITKNRMKASQRTSILPSL
jgi:hypothetical protein